MLNRAMLNRAAGFLYYFAAPAILVLIAGRQFYLSHAENLVAWKGGGFGMFATVDRPKYRFLRCYLLGDQGEIPLDPLEVANLDLLLEEQIRSLPQPERVELLATRIARATWVAVESESSQKESQAAAAGDKQIAVKSLTDSESGAGDHRAVDFSGVRVEVWRIDFNSTERRVVAHPLIKLAVARPPSHGG